MVESLGARVTVIHYVSIDIVGAEPIQSRYSPSHTFKPTEVTWQIRDGAVAAVEVLGPRMLKSGPSSRHVSRNYYYSFATTNSRDVAVPEWEWLPGLINDTNRGLGLDAKMV